MGRFIDSNIVNACIKEGHDVVMVDNLFTGKCENFDSKARFYLLDMRSEEIRKVFEHGRPGSRFRRDAVVSRILMPSRRRYGLKTDL